ncbi:MAG TPA: proton-conducting transporter membrane subunit, partial [Bellilinea sp.]|nr:proton-conducting transporter membrane subunit [Bellilinea sp.]
VSGFMAVAVKVAGFGVMMRIVLTAFPAVAAQLQPILVTLSALTMIFGNILAVSQRNIKRMLAYSSITHAGYLMMTVAAGTRVEFTSQAVAAILFYFVAYAASTFGAWSVVTALEQGDGHGNELEDFSGAGTKYPWLGICMLIFMISLTGIPVTLGFWGKLFLFRTAAEAGFTLLALTGLVMSLLSAFYYLRVIIFMFMRPREPKVRRDTLLTLVTVVMAVLVVGLSLIPNQLLQLASRAVLALQ